MLTRCPRCETTFRVTPEQLKARLGRVRCGHCQNVFNALDTLIEAVPPPVPVEPSPEPVEEALPPSFEHVEEAETIESAVEERTEGPIAIAANDEVAPPNERDAVEAFAAPQESGFAESPAEPESAESEPEPEPQAAPNLGLRAESDLEPQAEPEPEPQPEDEPVGGSEEETTAPFEPALHEGPAAKRAWPWAAGAALALVALILQAALHFRTEISVLYPETKPLLATACAPFGCEVALPHKPELIGIEASNLSPETAGRLSLSATLKNRAPFAQQYPNLELTLTDTGDQPLVRRVLVPGDYLPAGSDVAAGFGSGAELSVNLVVDAPGVPAAGYQLYLFYP